MPFKQTREVIDKARGFHRALSDFYHRMEGEADKERLGLLLDYLSRHEQRMEQRLAQFEADSTRPVLDAWFPYAPGEKIEEEIEQIVIRPEMSAAEIICLALRLDEHLLKFYRRAAELAPLDDVRELFQDLYEEGKKERVHVVHDVFELE